MAHYHVVESMLGCMPESDPMVCETRQDAELLAHLVEYDLRDAGYYRASGTLRQGILRYERNPDDIARVIEILACQDDSCGA